MDIYEDFYNYIDNNVDTLQPQSDFVSKCFNQPNLWFQEICSNKAKAISVSTQDTYVLKLTQKTNQLMEVSFLITRRFNSNDSASEFFDKDAFKIMNNFYPSLFNQFERKEENISLFDIKDEELKTLTNSKKYTYKQFVHQKIIEADLDKIFSICFFILTAKVCWKEKGLPCYKVFNDIYQSTPNAFDRSSKEHPINSNLQNLSNIIKMEELIHLDKDQNITQDSKDFIQLLYAF